MTLQVHYKAKPLQWNKNNIVQQFQSVTFVK